MNLDPVYPEITALFPGGSTLFAGDFELAIAALKLRLQRNPDSATSYALLASCYGHLERIAECRAGVGVFCVIEFTLRITFGSWCTPRNDLCSLLELEDHGERALVDRYALAHPAVTDCFEGAVLGGEVAKG